jgi:hypothetical protein
MDAAQRNPTGGGLECMYRLYRPTNKEGQVTEPIRLDVEIKTVYGKHLYYPTNDKAQMLAHIAGTDTLTPQTLKLAKDMGMAITFTHVIPQEVAGL